MANVLVQESSLEAIADAIRAKNGTQNTYKPGQMAEAIEAISGGGITPTGTKQISITANGTTTEDVTSYASAEITANVPNTYSASDEGKVVENGALVAQTSATYTENGTFDTTKINSVIINVQGSTSADNLPAFVMNQLAVLNSDEITSLPAYCCFNRSALQTVVLPSFDNALNDRAFQGCSNLEAVDFGGGTNFGAFSGAANPPFLNCSKLGIIILRKDTFIPLTPTAGTAATFNGTPFASTGTGGVLYVKQALVNSYKTGTNWTTWFADGGSHNNQVIPIEGSIYETQYADGTPISA